MLTRKKAVLKKGKEKILDAMHPWIFSGAFAGFPACEPGEVVDVVDYTGRFCAVAYLNPACSIAARILSFQPQADIEGWFEQMLQSAWRLRKQTVQGRTDGFRWIQAEGDGLPGLIIDVYGDIAVMQISTCGMERFRDFLLHRFETVCGFRGVYEKSNSASRKLEGLPEVVRWWKEPADKALQIQENGIHYCVDIERGQKTGFFLDQREMRTLVQQISKDLDVLNCYAYSGGFSLQALAGGARSVDSVDSSSDACQLMEKNLSLNAVDREKHRVFCQDAFTVLQEKPAAYDLVILDPPAFVKREKDKAQGRKKYLALNRLGLRAVKSSGYLLTASCSYFMDESTFVHMALEACKLEGRPARILSHHRMALDHPASLFHREGSYLKSLLLYVE